MEEDREKRMVFQMASKRASSDLNTQPMPVLVRDEHVNHLMRIPNTQESPYSSTKQPREETNRGEKARLVRCPSYRQLKLEGFLGFRSILAEPRDQIVRTLKMGSVGWVLYNQHHIV